MTRWWVLLSSIPQNEDGWFIITNFDAAMVWATQLMADDEQCTAWPLEALR